MTNTLPSPNNEALKPGNETTPVISELLATTDWDKVVATAMEDWRFGLRFAKALPLLSQPEQAIDADALANFATLLEAAGTKKPEAAPTEENSGWYIHGDLREATVEWIKSTAAVVRYMGKRRRDLRMHDLFATSEILTDITNLLLTQSVDDTEYKPPTLPAPIARAFERAVAQTITTFDKNEDAHREQTQRPSPVPFISWQGHEHTLQKTTGIDDIPAWIHERLSRYPARFKDMIGTIRFEDRNVNKDPDDQNVDNGLFNDETNTLSFDIYHAEFSYRRSKLEQSPEEAARDSKEGLAETFDHEMGHFIHANVLTVYELRAWQQALEQNTSAASTYITRLETTLPSDIPSAIDKQSRLNKEQFAVSFELYMNDMSGCYTRFPARFAFFNGLFSRYNMPRTAA